MAGAPLLWSTPPPAGLGRPMLEPAAAVPRAAWDVAALLLAVGDALSARFGAVAVRGELAAFSRAPSGHSYFSLKDLQGQGALLRCAMFRRAGALLDFVPRDGLQVELRGRLAVYEARGELQFIVESMRPLGEGALYEQFLRLKARLAAQGLFDAERKRALPRFPRRLGIVTSLQAAALRDVVAALARRAPHVGLVIYPSPVQGADAPQALAAALALANERREVDALLLCRGGGSLEDLWAFNDERVVRAVVASALPVVCGVGHESDVTLADLAADLRAPTPTAAAELAAPPAAQALDDLRTLARRLQRRCRHVLDGHAQSLDRRALQLARPQALLARHGTALQRLDARMAAALRQAVHGHGLHLQRQAGALVAAATARLHRAAARQGPLAARLQALDPHRVLARGYAWVADADTERPITSVQDAVPGRAAVAVWADGRAAIRIEGPLEPPPA